MGSENVRRPFRSSLCIPQHAEMEISIADTMRRWFVFGARCNVV